jgi:hypothetical protein
LDQSHNQDDQLSPGFNNNSLSASPAAEALKLWLPRRTGTKRLRIVHDRYNPFLIDRLLETIVSHFSTMQLYSAALVSKRWLLFARNRINQLLLFSSDTTALFSRAVADFIDDDDEYDELEARIRGLEKIRLVVNQRLRKLAQIRYQRLKTRFQLWRDNGLLKQALSEPPYWVLHLHHVFGFPLREFRTYTVDEVFNWIIHDSKFDDKCKEEWLDLMIESNVMAFVFRLSG